MAVSKLVTVSYRLTVSHMTFTEKTANIEVQFDVTDLSPGVYEATVAIRTNDINHLITHLPIQLFLFCGRLAPGKRSSRRPVLTDIKLSNHTQGFTESYRLSGLLRFHLPIASLDRMPPSKLHQAVAVMGNSLFDPMEYFTKAIAVGDGVIEELHDKGEDMCGTFSLRANVTIDQNPSSVQGQYRMTDFCIDILGNRLMDANGIFVPETRICVPLEIKSAYIHSHPTPLAEFCLFSERQVFSGLEAT